MPPKITIDNITFSTSNNSSIILIGHITTEKIKHKIMIIGYLKIHNAASVIIMLMLLPFILQLISAIW